MAPIHDTDIAEERWSKSEWESYELWEQIEVRLRRRRTLWISAAILLFLALSSVPIIIDRRPKWVGQAVARQLASLLNRVKREASVAHQAYQLTLRGEGNTAYEITRAENCGDTHRELVRQGSLLLPSQTNLFAILNPEQGRELGIPGLRLDFCYDPLKGSFSPEVLSGLGVVPAKDLTERRLDRISILLLRGPSAEISFD